MGVFFTMKALCEVAHVAKQLREKRELLNQKFDNQLPRFISDSFVEFLATLEYAYEVETKYLKTEEDLQLFSSNLHEYVNKTNQNILELTTLYASRIQPLDLSVNNFFITYQSSDECTVDPSTLLPSDIPEIKLSNTQEISPCYRTNSPSPF